MNPLVLFVVFLKASLFSSGGTGNLPSLHNDLIAAGVATDRTFAESLTIGQISPGPNGLWAVSLGYLTGGLGGACLAALAITLPPFLILGVERVYRRVEDHPAIEGFVRGMSLGIVGISVVIMLRLFQSNGVDIRSISIALLAAGLSATRRVPVALIIALAAVAGVFLYRT